MEVRLPPGRLFTWEDLQSIPDDEHHHYELFEGALLVSPSPDARHSRSTDRSLERLVYEEHGVENHWILDPAVPSLTALRLMGASYRQLAEVRAEEPYEAQHPFAVTVVPARLLDA